MTTTTPNATSSHRHRTATDSARFNLLPGRDDLLDAGFLLALGVIALLEFRTTYDGWTFLLVGVLGLLLGILITHLANVLGQPMIVLAAMGVIAFFLLGGAVALRGSPGDSPIPTAATLRDLATNSVHGWRDLLTTVPPVDGNGPLLVLPYILGVLTGLGGFALARRTKGAFWPCMVTLSTFVIVILLGNLHPGDVALPAAAFVVLGLVWITIRGGRAIPVVHSGSGQTIRIVTAAALVALAGAGAYLVGPHLPGGGTTRLLLRQHVTPPFNIGNYPSPLVKYRDYVTTELRNGQPVGLSKRTLFTVTGTLPAGSELQFATLDTYNGTVWAASNTVGTTTDRPDSFLRVGPTLNNPAAGPTYTMTVRVQAYDDYWMPTAGALQALHFTDPSAVTQARDFRYDLATGTGVVPSKLTSGSSYTLKVAGIADPVLKPNDVLASDGFSDTGSFLKSTAQSLASTPGTTTAQILRIAKALKATGRYTHGDPSTGFAYYLPGHSQGRLTDFVRGILPGAVFVGDDEQYAAAYALMIEQLGVPARVVVGVESMPADGVVTGADVAAWVQVQTAARSWRTIPTAMFLNRNNPPDKKQLRHEDKKSSAAQVPPPAQGHPKTVIDDTAEGNFDSTSVTKKHAGTKFTLPGWLVTTMIDAGAALAALTLLISAVIAAKATRRRRRRTRGTPGSRLSAGWREITDHMRDLGAGVSARATRREQAVELAPDRLGALARTADAHIFGDGPITDEHAKAYWRDVLNMRSEISRSLTRWQRLRAAVNLATFAPTPRQARP